MHFYIYVWLCVLGIACPSMAVFRCDFIKNDEQISIPGVGTITNDFHFANFESFESLGNFVNDQFVDVDLLETFGLSSSELGVRVENLLCEDVYTRFTNHSGINRMFRNITLFSEDHMVLVDTGADFTMLSSTNEQIAEYRTNCTGTAIGVFFNQGFNATCCFYVDFDLVPSTNDNISKNVSHPENMLQPVLCRTPKPDYNVLGMDYLRYNNIVVNTRDQTLSQPQQTPAAFVRPTPAPVHYVEMTNEEAGANAGMVQPTGSFMILDLEKKPIIDEYFQANAGIIQATGSFMILDLEKDESHSKENGPE